jgi:hypothetical protein
MIQCKNIMTAPSKGKKSIYMESMSVLLPSEWNMPPWRKTLEHFPQETLCLKECFKHIKPIFNMF